MSSSENTVVVKDLEKRFGAFVAVNRVSFEAKRAAYFHISVPTFATKQEFEGTPS